MAKQRDNHQLEPTLAVAQPPTRANAGNGTNTVCQIAQILVVAQTLAVKQTPVVAQKLALAQTLAVAQPPNPSQH